MPSDEYSQWARNPRPESAVYRGGAVPAAATGYDDSLDNTGSLTGRILAYGRPDTDPTGHTGRVVMLMLVALAVVVVITVIAIS